MTAAPKPDRYQSFIGIDCEGNARRVLEMLCRHLDDPAVSNPFWDRFRKAVDLIDAPEDAGACRRDALFLIHAYINNIQDFLEERRDTPALALLARVESECC